MTDRRYCFQFHIVSLTPADSMPPFVADDVAECSQGTLMERPMQIALLSVARSSALTQFTSASLLLHIYIYIFYRRDTALRGIDARGGQVTNPLSGPSMHASRYLNSIPARDCFPRFYSGSRDIKINRAKGSFRSRQFCVSILLTGLGK